MKGNKSNFLFLILVLAVGGLLGNLIGSILGDHISILSASQSVGVEPPVNLDLNFLQLKFGFMFNINLAGVIGLIVSFWIFSRL